MLRYSV